MAVSLLVFGTSATSSQPDPVDCWSVRENNTGCVCVCVWVEGLLDDDNDDEEREKKNKAEKNISESLCTHRFIKVHLRIE